MSDEKLEIIYGAKVLRPSVAFKISVSEPDKWAVFKDKLHTFYLKFMMVSCFAVAIYFANLIGG